MLRAPRRCSKVGPTRPRDKQFRAAPLSTSIKGWWEGVDVPFNLKAVRSGRRPQLRATDGIIMAEGFDRVISTNRDERTTDAIETLFYRLLDRFGSRTKWFKSTRATRS
ncbi:hypothetical protein CEXT_754611 [Caerostris extrusa]|uniref:Uncharacterized protein n=1 Tax=Caerostris extrusa TaxID=172846 RepID=A0AAV4NSI5_CAEEX|nr:hypothetical protein CEXT_754611 [Caerostris extrusa]